MANAKTLDANGQRKFGMMDKLAYAAGDLGCNMSFALKGYLTIYWTQYMGLNAYVVSMLLLICQVWDAINDPLLGAIIDADHRKYRRNKFLTYIWVGSIGLLVAGALCYLPFPNAPALAKDLLFVLGYMAWDAFYTVANVPYGSMLSLITTDPVERAQLSTWRNAGAMAAGIGTGIVIPMIIYDASNNLRGQYMFAIALVMGVIGFIFFQITVNKTVIRVDTEVEVSEKKEKFNFFKAFGLFLRNRPAVGVTLSAMGMFLGMYGASTATQIMFQTYFKAARYSGLFSMISYVGVFLYMPIIAKLVKRFGKKELATAGAIFTACAYVLLLIVPVPTGVSGLVVWAVFQLLATLGNGAGTCVSYSMMADAIDYAEWKFNVREEGTTYALHSFFRKLAQGIGPSIGLSVATALGYNAALGANQTEAVTHMARYLAPSAYLVAALFSVVGYGLVFNLDKKTLNTMTEELKARKAQS